MTGLTQNAAAVEAAITYTGTTAFGLGVGSMFGPPDLYRPLGLTSPHHQRTSTTTTPPTSSGSKLHQHRCPFAIQQLLGLGPDKKPTNDPLLSAQRDDYPPLNVNKTKDYREYQEKLR